MKTSLLLLLMPLFARGQSNSDLLAETAHLLAINRNPARGFFLTGNLADKQLETTRKTAQYYVQQGSRYAFAHDYGKAIALFEKATELDPRQHAHLGYTLLSQWHDYPRALKHLDAFDSLTSNFDDVYNNNPVGYLRGLAYQQMGDHPKAIAQMSRSIDSIDCKHGSQWVNYRYFINRAVSYLALRQPDKALADLNKAVLNFDRSALAQYYRGRAFLALNLSVYAKAAYQDALFYLRALRVQRGNYDEDEYNPVCEEQLEEALAKLN